MSDDVTIAEGASLLSDTHRGWAVTRDSSVGRLYAHGTLRTPRARRVTYYVVDVHRCAVWEDETAARAWQQANCADGTSVRRVEKPPKRRDPRSAESVRLR